MPKKSNTQSINCWVKFKYTSKIFQTLRYWARQNQQYIYIYIYTHLCVCLYVSRFLKIVWCDNSPSVCSVFPPSLLFSLFFTEPPQRHASSPLSHPNTPPSQPLILSYWRLNAFSFDSFTISHPDCTDGQSRNGARTAEYETRYEISGQCCYVHCSPTFRS